MYIYQHRKTIQSLSFIGAIILLLLAPVQTFALSDAQKQLYDIGIGYYDIEPAATQTCGAGAGTGSTDLPASIPDIWRNLINSVAATYPTADPRLVATTLWVENRGWPQYKTTGWSDSSAGAQGPWQFIAATWATMGTDGDGDGLKDPNNPKDAVHAAFKHQLGSAKLPIASQGYTGTSPEADFDTVVFQRENTNLLYYAAKYNGRGAPDGVKLNAFPRGENADYVIMTYWLLASNFAKGYLMESAKFVDASKTGTLFGGSPSGVPASASLSACGSGASVDGYAFPVGPQRKSQNGGLASMSTLPCNRASCHHDGSAAFDISRQPGGDAAVGTPIYAITSGKLTNIRNSYKGQAGCQSFQLVGSDGFYYWHGHIQNVSVKENQPVTAGQQIAIEGERRCTGNGSDPHLHIDRGCVINGVKQPGGSDDCRDPGINELMNKLFNGLPE